MVYCCVLSGFFLCCFLATTVLGKAEFTKPSKSAVDDFVQPVAKSCGPNKSCVQSYLCDNGRIVTDGRTVINMRAKLFAPEGNDGCEWTETCCIDEDKIEVPDKEYKSRGCGYSNPKGIEINIQNTESGDSQFAEFPWMLSIWEYRCSEAECTYIAQGGGSLLAPNVVLTTAHKIYDISIVDLMVRAGDWDSSKTSEPYPHQERDVESKIIHENFDSIRALNDAALLILKTPLKLSPHIDTICLPRLFDDFNQRRCIVTGWGKKHKLDSAYPKLLKKIDVPFVNSSLCQKQLRETRLGYYFKLHKSFACAGGEADKDACLGDGGSPLACPMINDANRYTLAGVVSWGIECGTENVPGVYVNIHMLRSWIIEKLADHQISDSYYLP